MILEFGLGIFCTASAISLYRRSAQRAKREQDSNRPILRGSDKVAALMMSLPPELVAEIFKGMHQDTVTRVAMSIAQLPPMTDEMRTCVLRETLEQALHDSGIGQLPHDPGPMWLSLAQNDPALVAKIVTHLYNSP